MIPWMWATIFICGAFFLGGLVQGSIGFGMALTAVPLLAFILPVRVLLPLSSICGMIITLPIVWKTLRAVRWGPCAALVLSSLPGALCGATLLRRIPPAYLLGFLGFMLVGTTLQVWLLRRPKALTHRPGHSLLFGAGAGFVSGLVGAATGVFGPPLLAYLNLQPWPHKEIRATLNIVFLAQAMVCVVAYEATGILKAETLDWLPWAIPSLLAGAVAGLALYEMLHRQHGRVERIFQGSILVLGLLLVVKAVCLLKA